MRVGVVAVALLALGVSAAASASAVRKPTLTLSQTSGGAGTRIEVRAEGCTRPRLSPDTLAWHDHYYWLHDVQKRPPLGVWRRIAVTRTSRTTAKAVFVVLRSDHPGRGLLDMFCGGVGNATAAFTVTR